MKQWITGATFAVALIGFAAQASASTLAPGATGQTPDVFTTGGFALQTSNTGQLISSGTFTATASTWVYTDTANVFCSGCLDFVYQVERTGGTDVIESVVAGSFTGFSVDAGYVAGVNVVPSTVDRSVAGNNVTFDFANPNVTGTNFTNLLVVETNARYYTTGGFTVTDNQSANASGFSPTLVPEPMTFSLMGAGLLGLGLLRKRIGRN
jgi:hypothetical protein